jgi:transposase InsO family protein
MYVYWDVASEKVAAYRRAADGEQPDADDMFPYAVVGRRGIERLVKKFRREIGGGLSEGIAWPESEEQMLEAQMPEQRYPEWIGKLRRGEKLQAGLTGTIMRLEIPNEVEEDAAEAEGRRPRRLAMRARPRTRPAKLNRKGQVKQPASVVVLPPQLVPLAMRYCHECNGHPGVSRMDESMRKRYWWQGMQKDIKEHVERCRPCNLRKASNMGKKSIPLLRPELPHSAWHTIHMDWTELQESEEGYKYILVIKDALSQWLEMIPVRTKTMEEIAEATMRHVLMRHGAPARIITDQGTEFVNEVSRALNTLMAIRHIITTPYNPQANGKVEGANRTIKDMLSMYVQGHQRDWDKYLQIIAFQYNTTINVATGYSPFYVMHGREARQPSDQWIEEYWQAIGNEESLDTLIGKLTQALRESWMVAATNIEAAHQRQDGKGTAIAEDRPARVGTKRVMGHFRPGDTFYMRTLPQLVFEDPIEERQ